MTEHDDCGCRVSDKLTLIYWDEPHNLSRKHPASSSCVQEYCLVNDRGQRSGKADWLETIETYLTSCRCFKGRVVLYFTFLCG